MKCEQCNNTLINNQKRFCSHKCHSKSLIKPDNHKNIICKGCLSSFIGRFHRKYCSNNCYQKSLRGKKLTIEHKRKMSKSHKGKIGHPNTDEQKRKSSERWTGSKNPKWQPDRKKLKIRQKTRSICHGLVRRCVRNYGKTKLNRTLIELGYSAEDFQFHIESLFKDGMSWENYGFEGWHIDHIKPISAFDSTATIKEINSLDNLQPLWAKENFKKGGRF